MYKIYIKISIKSGRLARLALKYKHTYMQYKRTCRECVHSGRNYYQGVLRIARAQNCSKYSPRIGVPAGNICNIQCKKPLWLMKIVCRYFWSINNCLQLFACFLPDRKISFPNYINIFSVDLNYMQSMWKSKRIIHMLINTSFGFSSRVLKKKYSLRDCGIFFPKYLPDRFL